jgi:hypothetical protein
MGVAPSGAAQPNGTDFWWDNYPGNTGNCWWGNIAAPGRVITTSPLLLPSCADGTDPSSSIGSGDPANEAELTGCLVGLTIGSYPNGTPALCDWTKTPAKPGASSTSAADGSEIARTRQSEFVALCDQLPQNRTCAPFVGAGMAPSSSWAPTPSSVRLSGAWARRALGLYTCRDWTRANGGLRSRLLARLSHWTSGPVDGDALVGYGTVLPDNRAAEMFNSRCAPRYARSFALYKMYGMAAGFAGVG